jgi:predicted metalloprotease with PDZ domain
VQFNLQPPVPDEIELLRAGLEKQMRDAKLKAADRDVINKGIEQLADARNAGPVGMEKYTEQCDEFRKTLAKYKLDAGELLPPPAKSRLGISVATENGHVLVQSVSDKSRAQRLGVQAGDEIRKVDGKAISDVGELRKATIAKEKGMIMEITRDGKELKLEEKEEKK